MVGVGWLCVELVAGFHQHGDPDGFRWVVCWVVVGVSVVQMWAGVVHMGDEWLGCG